MSAQRDLGQQSLNDRYASWRVNENMPKKLTPKAGAAKRNTAAHVAHNLTHIMDRTLVVELAVRERSEWRAQLHGEAERARAFLQQHMLRQPNIWQ